MGSFSEGMAYAIQEGNMLRAQASASSASLRALDAERERDTEKAKSQAAQTQAAVWKNETLALREALKSESARFLGAIGVIRGLMDIMEKMPADEREAFRDKLAQRSRLRISELDEKYDRQYPIVNAFGETKTSKALGIL